MTEPNQLQGTYVDRVATYLDRAGFSASKTSVDKLPGDASDRRYVRIVSPDGTSHVLLVHSEPIDPETLPFVNVARLLRRMSIPVPSVLGWEGDLGILVLEDLGDVTLQRNLQHATDEDRIGLYTEATELIERMQRRGRDLASSVYVPFGLAFDAEKLTWELEFFVKHFLIGHYGAALSPSDQETLSEEFALLAGELAAEPRVFCHRDYHSRNLMLHAGRLHVIDFQDARMGPDTYDLVSLLRDSYVEHDWSFVSEMIGRYLRLTRGSTESAFLPRFDLMSVQRHLKVLGTFGYQTTMVGTERYRDDVPRTLRYLRDVFRRRPQFARLRSLLAAHLAELA